MTIILVILMDLVGKNAQPKSLTQVPSNCKSYVVCNVRKNNEDYIQSAEM